MNRSALVIQMLHILYGRNKVISREELAHLLDTNVRNIVEFKKELETAGYEIESITGKYGGYRLKEESIFPSLNLMPKEKVAINEALTYMESQKQFLYYEDFQNAMNKLKAKVTHQQKSSDTIYLSESRKQLSAEENLMIDLFNEAKEKHLCVAFEYCSAASVVFEKRRIQPYEIIVNQEGFYVLGYDLTKQKNKDYKFFKITKERMKHVCLTNQIFIRDPYFKVSDHSGKHGLMKELFEVELEISGMNARLINESEVENTLFKSYQNGVLTIRFMMEGKMRLKKFILSLGEDCIIKKPLSLKQEIIEELQKMIQRYNEKEL